MVEMADILRRHGEEYRLKYADRMLPSHQRAMRDIEECRTPIRGGSLHGCPECPEVLEYSYHSCKNRACPKCGNGETTRWLERQRALLLPVDYFMVTYTLPAEFRTMARSNQKKVYGAFFRASAQSFQELARQKKHLGGQVGMMGVLQTWTRDLMYHPHIHYIVPGGALSSDGASWLTHRYKEYLLPEKALAARFKKKFKVELIKAGLIDQVPECAWDKKWVVDCEPVGSGDQVLKYIAPYIFRIAISNNRIEKLEDGKVTFKFKNRDEGQWIRKTLPAVEFIRRFLQHVLPKRFVKIRYYGFLAAQNRRNSLKVIRTILQTQCPPDCKKPNLSIRRVTAKQKKRCCPKCGAELVFISLLPRGGREPPVRSCI